MRRAPICQATHSSHVWQALTTPGALRPRPGAGACALPLAFLHHLPSSSRIAAVDFDPEVLAVARSHFIAASLAAEGGGLRVAEGAVAAGLDAALAAAASRAAEGERGQPAATTVSETAASASHSAPRLALLQGDGAEFLSRSAEGAFDVIIVDCATGAGEEAGAGLQAPPPPLASSDALRALRRALAPGGVAAVNVFGERSAERGFEARPPRPYLLQASETFCSRWQHNSLFARSCVRAVAPDACHHNSREASVLRLRGCAGRRCRGVSRRRHCRC